MYTIIKVGNRFVLFTREMTYAYTQIYTEQGIFKLYAWASWNIFVVHWKFLITINDAQLRQRAKKRRKLQKKNTIRKRFSQTTMVFERVNEKFHLACTHAGDPLICIISAHNHIDTLAISSFALPTNFLYCFLRQHVIIYLSVHDASNWCAHIA